MGSEDVVIIVLIISFCLLLSLFAVGDCRKVELQKQSLRDLHKNVDQTNCLQCHKEDRTNEQRTNK